MNASVDDTTPLAIERRTVYVFTLMGGGGTILSSCLHISPGCTEVFLFSWFTFITDIHTNYFFGYSILYAFSRHNRSISINHSSECRLSSGVIPYTAFTTPMEREGGEKGVFLGLAHQTTLLKTVM